MGGEIRKVVSTGEGRVRRDKYSPPLETMPRQKASVLIGFQTCNKTCKALKKGVKLGGEIRKVVSMGEGRLRRDKYSPPLETGQRQNPDALIGFKTCNKNLYSCREEGHT